jgi:hypothetical protein
MLKGIVFKMNGKNIFLKFYENLGNLLCSKVMLIFNLTQMLLLSIWQFDLTSHSVYFNIMSMVKRLVQ